MDDSYIFAMAGRDPREDQMMAIVFIVGSGVLAHSVILGIWYALFVCEQSETRAQPLQLVPCAPLLSLFNE